MDIVKDYLRQNLRACDNLIRDWILDAELLLDGSVSVVFVVGNHDEDEQRPSLCPEISSTYAKYCLHSMADMAKLQPFKLFLPYY